MLRNITAAQKITRYFYKSDALAQTNQIKYDCLFCMAQKLFSQNLKLDIKIPATFF